MWILGILVIAIWGAVVYRIVDAIAQGDSGDNIVQGSAIAGTTRASGQFAYKEDVRDPFAFRAEPPRKPGVKRDTTVGAGWTEPPFKLVGIMQKDRLTTAVLQRNDGATFFVRKGDTLSGLKVLAIDQESMKYEYRNQRRSWTLVR